MSRRSCVLVVDDEASQRFVLRQYLASEGYEVVEAADGVSALEVLRSRDIDLALLDVMMPGLGGMDVVRLIRQESRVPVILITARGEESSRIAGLDAGADDYVVKPFSAPEVMARVRARLRSGKGEPAGAPSTLTAGDIEIDLGARRCSVAGTEVALTRREFDLLATLVRNEGRVLSREQLLESAWGTTHLTAKTVDVHLTKLRAKLGDAFGVSALRGVGYRFEA